MTDAINIRSRTVPDKLTRFCQSLFNTWSAMMYGQQTEKHTKGTNGKIWKKDISQILRIDMDDEVVPAMDKNPKEMAKEICLVASVK